MINTLQTPFCALLLLGFSLSIVSAHPQAPSVESKETQYDIACSYLAKGRKLENAISTLTKLVEQQPDNCDYQLALGCALTSRLASISCVEENMKIAVGAKKMFERRVKIWEQMQGDPTMPLHGTPKPTPPVFTVTPDDQRNYDPAKEGAAKRTRYLVDTAVQSFHRAYRLSRAFPIARRTQIDYTFGWGMLLVYRFAGDNLRFKDILPAYRVDNPKSEEQKQLDEKTIFHDEVIGAFQECVDAKVPINRNLKANYLQSMAFAEAPDFLNEVSSQEDLKKLTESNVNRIAVAITHLKQAQIENSGGENLPYQLALFCMYREPDTAINALKQIASTENNGVAYYLLAVALASNIGQQTGPNVLSLKKEIFDVVDAGNHAADYHNHTLALPLPRLLAPAWNYRSFFGLGADTQCLKQLFSFLSPASPEIDAVADDILFRQNVLLMELGLNALKHYQGNDLPIDDPRTQIALYQRGFYGFIACGKANKQIQKLAMSVISPDDTAMAQRYAQMQSYFQAWDTALTR